MDGAEAARDGLVTRAVEDAEVEATAAVMAAPLAALPPGAVEESKRLLRAPRRGAEPTPWRRSATPLGAAADAEAQAIFDAFLNRKG